MNSDIFTNILSYTALLVITGLLFPTPKAILAFAFLATLFLFLIHTAISKPAVAFYYLIFISVPVAAFIVPSPIPPHLPPLLQLAVAVAMWGSILSFIISIAILISNYTERRSGPASTSRPDHVLQKRS